MSSYILSLLIFAHQFPQTKIKKMRFSLILITTIVLVAWQQEWNTATAQVHFKKGAPFVILANGGLISGMVKFSRDGRPFNSFTGIPYATAPERFQEPQPITAPSWEGIFSATKPGPLCPQIAFGAPVEGDRMVEMEDCLNLNVYVPMNNTGTGKKGYPVMVWIHGGGFVNGGGFAYGPQFFMDEDVILVTINYRLAAFGFLSTGDNVIPGNNGMKDMVLALKWVQENIKKFGGDAGKVTIFGESAGGGAVHHLLLSPTTKGLFHRAISQSGSVLNQWAYSPNPKQIAVQLATHLNCPTTAADPSGISSQEILTCLKGVSMTELKTAMGQFRPSWPLNLKGFYFAPTTEPSDLVSNLTPFQSEPPASILTRKDSKLQEIPWMVGATEDEGASMYAGILLSNPEILKEANTDWDRVAPSGLDYDKYIDSKEEQTQIAQKVRQFYFGDKEISQETIVELTNLFSDEMFLHGVYRSAMETASRGKRNPVYLYQYAYRGPHSLTAMTFHVTGELAEKSAHGDDLQHLFDCGKVGDIFMGADGGELKIETEEDEQFSKNFVRLWASFAIHGEPKHSWGTATFNRWKSISKKEIDGVTPQKWFRIEANAGPAEIEQSVKDRMQFWDTLWSDHLTQASIAGYKPTEQKTGTKDKTEL